MAGHAARKHLHGNSKYEWTADNPPETMKLFERKPLLASTPFSDFIRKANSREKKRVSKQVLRKASESQRHVIERARARKK